MRFVVFSIIALLLCASSAYALDRNGLVLYLPLDEGVGGTAVDASGSGNYGELVEGAEWVEGQGLLYPGHPDELGTLFHE